MTTITDFFYLHYEDITGWTIVGLLLMTGVAIGVSLNQESAKP